MRSFPLPIRVAAGLAATAVEQTRQLPSQLLGLPVTVASQALQVSMRIQQQVTELAIKGDEALSALTTPEEQPEWATFDEDDFAPPARSPWDLAADARADDDGAADDRAADDRTDADEPQVVDDDVSVRSEYDQLTLPQLRGKLRGFSVDELAELLDHEQEHGQRPEFLRMLSNRLERLRSAE